MRRLRAEGREPLPEIRRCIEQLKPHEGLEITAPFIPSPLIELLGSEGYEHSLEHDESGGWITRFWRE